MAQTVAAAGLPDLTPDPTPDVTFVQPKALRVWGFLRRSVRAATLSAQPVALAEQEYDQGLGDYDEFGRAGLQIGGLYRDRQWVGAWGGRC